MAARLKSSVLRREERGIGNITMGRLIACAMIGGVAFLGMRVVGIPSLMIPGGVGSFVGALILTGLRHGIPLYRHLYITLKARLLVGALTDEASWQGQVVGWLDANPAALTLDTVKLLSAPVLVEEGTLDEWEIVTDSGSTAGFEVVTDTFYMEGQ